MPTEPPCVGTSTPPPAFCCVSPTPQPDNPAPSTGRQISPNGRLSTESASPLDIPTGRTAKTQAWSSPPKFTSIPKSTPSYSINLPRQMRQSSGKLNDGLPPTQEELTLALFLLV